MEEKKKNVYIVPDKTDTYKVYSKEKDACDMEIASLDEYNRFSDDECTRMVVSRDATSVYILHIMEDKGGESYGSETWQSAYESKRDLIEDAVDWYDSEHNRDDSHCEGCKRCAVDESECKKRFISRMKGRGYSKISSCLFAHIYKVDIDAQLK